MRLVQVSTDEVYGDLEAGGSSTRDATRCSPSSPYSAAKAAGDLLVPAYARTFGVNASITRGSNTYGPNQYPEKFIPLFVTNALDGEPLPLYGDGRQVRDWLYVEDHCAGIELVLREGAPGEIYNVGGGDEHENIDVAERDRRADRRRPLAAPQRRRPAGHDRRYSLDTRSCAASAGRRRGLRGRACARPSTWYRDNRAWWEPIKSGEYREYYERQYAERSRTRLASRRSPVAPVSASLTSCRCG